MSQTFRGARNSRSLGFGGHNGIAGALSADNIWVSARDSVFLAVYEGSVPPPFR